MSIVYKKNIYYGFILDIFIIFVIILINKVSLSDFSYVYYFIKKSTILYVF